MNWRRSVRRLSDCSGHGTLRMRPYCSAHGFKSLSSDKNVEKGEELGGSHR